ncbi:hypothetical protein DD237_002692 [Peronospora effusa]|uniref:FYVE-type domain-containing protein n=1 Tax=Peronospora effusa TaxID=542832 RepID=A0A3R7XW43_9STRA|nr:hypothetical protein DD237_002692 [Peronospora effusa]
MRKVRALSQRRAPSNAVGDDFWQAPSLTASERAYMIRKAKEASVALVDHAHTLDGPVQWHYTGKLHGIQMYRGEGSYDRGGNSGTEFLCGVTTMMGSIEEVAVYFDQQTTEEMIAKKAEDVLDCGVLYSLVRGDVKNPFYRVSAKYQLYEGPSAFSRERDYCFLECQNTFRHASGRRGWVLSMHSIKLPNCPELDGVVRGSMYQSGYVFVEAEKDGYMDVMHSLQINFKTTSRLPHFMLNSALKRRILSVVTISREIRTTRMGRQTLLKKKELMPKRARALCVNCARKFSLFVRKTRCRVCGEVVCQPCAPQVMISTKQGPVKTRVCTRCYQLSPGDEYESVSAQPQSHNRDYLRRAQNNTRYSDILQDQYDHPDLYHEKDEDSLGEEDEDDGGLEEQSDFSVFAQSRFTEASRDSLATSQFGASNFESYFEESSHFDSTSELDDSQYYDGGSSESSFVSGTSSSQWKGDNSAASSIMGWNQASSVKPADGYIYDPQASTSSNFYGASDYGGSHYTIDDKSDKQAGRDKAAAPIPENEPSSHPVYTISPDTSYISNTDYKSTQGTADTSDQGSNAKATQGAQSDSSCASPSSDCASKTVSIQSLAKARSAHYGIKSEFPPPPPPLSPPSEEHEESEENASSLHLKVLKLDKSHSLQDRKPKGTATRKFFTPPPPKEGRREVDQTLAERDSKVARNMAFHAALANRDSRVSQASSRDSNGFGNTRSSAILEKVRRNRGRESDRASAVLKFKEEEHLMRMREIERIQGLAKEKAARRSMASSEKSQVIQNGGLSHAAAKKKKEQPRRSSHRSTAVSLLDSSFGPSPGSPPGTPPSMRGRRFPNDASSKIQSNRSISGNYSRRTDASSNIGGKQFLSNRSDASSDIGGKQFLSNRSDANFARPGARVSLEPSAQSDDLRSEYHVSNDSQYLNGQRLNGSPGASKRSKPSLGGQQLDSSYVSAISEHRLLDDLAFDASQLSLDKTNFSSSIAILEIPGESLDHIAMMERSSEVRSSIDSMLSEDLLNQSSAGMIEHINAMRARAAYKLPDEEGLPSYELQRRQEEHFKRMEELTKMTANHIAEENIRPRSSTLGGLHDSAISLTGYSGNNFGDSTISSSSSVSSVDVDQEFNFESRPLGRSKRSGTIPFALEDLEQVPDVEDDDKLSEGPDDFDTSIRLSEEHAEHGYKNEQEYRLSEECADMNTQVSLPTYHFGDEYVGDKHEHKNEPIEALCRSSESVESEHGLATPPHRSSGLATPPRSVSGSVTPSRRSSVGTVGSKHGKSSGAATPPRRLSVDSVISEHEHTIGLATPPRRSSVESVENKHEHTSGLATPPRRSSVESVENKHEHTSGLATPPRHSSVGNVESKHEKSSGVATPPRRSSVESVESEHEHTNGLGIPPPYSSVEAVGNEHEHTSGLATLPRRFSAESMGNEHEHKSGLATPPHRLSVGSIQSKKGKSSGVATPPRRSSVESVESEHEHQLRLSEKIVEHAPERNSGHVSPLYRPSDEKELEHERNAGTATPPRRSSVGSVKSEHKQNTGLATPPTVASDHDQDTGFITPPRRLPVESEESEYDHTSGLATPPRRRSCVESESDRGQQTGYVTSPFRLSMKSEHLQTNDLAQSVESAESERDHESGSDSDRLSDSSSEDSVEHQRDTDVEEAAHRSSEKPVEIERDYKDANSAYRSSAKQECDPLHEPAYRLSGGTESEDTVAAPPSNEPVALEKSVSKFLPQMSQLIPGESGLAVDEFFADSRRSLSDRKLPQVNENDDEDTDTLNLYQKRLHLSHTTSEDSNSAIAPISNDTDISEFGISSRESCISAIDEELVGRPTNELFDMIRANRPMYNSGGSRSSDMMFDLEASHLRRMDELNRIAIDHLGNRISNLDDDMLGSAIQPGRLLHRGHRNEEKAMQWRSSDVMEEVYTKHQVDMERLRRRIRQLEEECRESIASVLTAEEMDLSEFDDDGSEPTHKGFIGRPSFNPQNSFMARSDLSSSTISEHGGTDMPIDEPLPARILFEQIAQLTQLQQEMAEAECDDDEEEYRKRIKEQYRVLRSIKANSREDLELLNSQARESVNEDEDEENWI